MVRTPSPTPPPSTTKPSEPQPKSSEQPVRDTTHGHPGLPPKTGRRS